MTGQCSKCGALIQSGDRFCGACGQPVSPVGEVGRDGEKTVDARQPAADRSRRLGKVGLAVAGAILLVVGGYQMMEREYGHVPVATEPTSPASPSVDHTSPPAPVQPAPRVLPRPDSPRDTRDTPAVGAQTQETPPRTSSEAFPFAGIPGLPEDHPLNEFLKRLPRPQGQETARATPTPGSPVPDAQSEAGGWLGAKIQDIDTDMAAALGLPRAEGAIVAEVIAGGPASEKLKPGDAILEIDGQSVRDARDARTRLGSHAPGEPVRLRVLRNGDRIMIAVRLGSWSNSPSSAK